jgi:transposase
MKTASGTAPAAAPTLNVRAASNTARRGPTRGRPRGSSPAAVEERRQRAGELYAQGLSLEGVAAKLGVSKRQAGKDLDALGISRRRTDANAIAARRTRVAELYAQGLPCEKVATLVGASAQTIWRDLVALGVERRPAGRRNSYAGTREERRERARTLYAEHHSTTKVAAELGVSQFCVWSDLAPLGVLRPRPRLTPDERRAVAQSAVRRYRDGKLTLEQVGAELDRSETTILRYLAELGVDRREAVHLWWATVEGRAKALRAVAKGVDARQPGAGLRVLGRHARELAAANGKTVGRRSALSDTEKERALNLAAKGKSERTIAGILTYERRERDPRAKPVSQPTVHRTLARP